MRSFESLLLLLLAARIVVVFTRHSGWARALGAAACGVMVVHLLAEGVRWMLGPAYGAVVVFSVLAIRPAEPRTWARWAGGALAVLAVVISGTLAWILPVPEFEAPGRPVGTTLVEVDGASGPLPVRLYYPTAERGTSEYWTEAERVAFARKYGLPTWATSHLALAEVPANEGAAVEGGPWPLVVFSHGYHTPPSSYEAFLPALAARGYVVAAPHVPGEATVVVFPDGRTLPFDQAQADSLYGGDIWERVAALNAEWDAAQTEAERLRVFRTLNAFYPDADKVRGWATELLAVLDAIPDLAPLTGAVDTSRVALVGHSMGGSAVSEACLRDSRADACVNWDGAMWGSMVDDTLRTPMLSLEAPPPPGAFRPNETIFRAAHAGEAAPFVRVEVPGTGHASFGDLPAIIRLASLNEGGSVGVASEAVVERTDAFLRDHLNPAP